MDQAKNILGLILVTFVFAFPIAKTEAQAPVYDAANFIVNEATMVSASITAGVTTTQTTWETIKENWLNMLAYQAGQLALNQVTENIVTWIQSGFEGDPSFAIDPKRLFNDLADMVAGDLAAQIRGLAVCDFDANFKLNLMNSLLLVQDNDKKVERKLVCPFDVVDVSSCDKNGQNCKTISPAKRAEAFQQSFTNGLWGMYEASLRDNGNKFGVALVTKREVDRRTAESAEIQKQKLTQSGGFLDVLNMESCNYPTQAQARMDSGEASPADVQAYKRAYCTVGTPGSIVGSQLSKTMGIDIDRLGFADNLNKIATAFIQQLAKTAIEGIYTPGVALASPPGLQTTLDNVNSCIGASTDMTDSQRAEVATLVAASPRVRNTGTAQDNAQLNFDNAAQTLEDLTAAAVVAEGDYNKASESAQTALADYTKANNDLSACIAQGRSCTFASSGIPDPNLGGFFTKQEVFSNKLEEAKGALYSPSNTGVFISIEKLPTQPTSKEAIKNAKFVAWQAANAKIAPNSDAVREYSSTEAALNNAIEEYSKASDAAEQAAIIQVTGLQMVSSQQDCTTSAINTSITQ